MPSLCPLSIQTPRKLAASPCLRCWWCPKLILLTQIGRVDLQVTVSEGLSEDNPQPVQRLSPGQSNSEDRDQRNPSASPGPASDSSGPLSQASLVFRVSDTGVGIPAEELDNIFDAFVQTPIVKRSHRGTGLGLAISRQFFSLLGGEITVCSEVWEGSTFMFNIPLVLTEETQDIPQPPQHHVMALAPGQPRYRLLVVDDSRPHSLDPGVRL